jgi:hypothetical protein
MVKIDNQLLLRIKDGMSLILSPLTGQLSRLLLRTFNLDDFPAGIASTGRANMMGQLRAVELRTIVYLGRSQSEVTAPLAPACLCRFPLW